MADTKISGATALNTTGILSTPVAKNGSTTAFRRVDNISASSSPGASDDSGSGYCAGSMWFRVDTGELFECRDATSTAAVWIKVGIQHPGYIATRWYQFLDIRPSSATAVAFTANTIKLIPFLARHRISISDMGTRIGTNAANNMQFAIYAADPSTLKPTGNALSSTPNVSTNSTGNQSGTLTANVQLELGKLYWAAINSDSGTATTTTTDIETSASRLVGTTTLANILGSSGTGFVGYSVAQTFGTWPDLTSASFTELTATQHMLYFKCASVP